MSQWWTNLLRSGIVALVYTPLSLSCSDTNPGTTNADPDADVQTEFPADLRVYTFVSPSHLRAGEVAQVFCVVEDTLAVRWSAPTQIVVPPEVVLEGTTVKSEQAGTWPIRCELTGDVESVEEWPVDLTVTPGTTTQLEIVVEPEQPYYTYGDVVAVGASLIDVFGSVYPADTRRLSIVSKPTQAVEVLDDTHFRLMREGPIGFEATWTDDDGDTVTNSRVVVVDGLSPELDVTYPGELNQWMGDGSPVLVQGSVKDIGTGLASVTVNGTAVTVADDGTFETELPVQQGLNLLEVEAVDFAGNHTTVHRSWLQSTEWTDVTQTPDPMSAPDGITLRLGQSAIDDGVWQEDFIGDLGQALLTLQANIGGAWTEYTPWVDNVASFSGVEEGCRSYTIEATRVRFAPLIAGIEIGPQAAASNLSAVDGGFELAWTGTVTAQIGLGAESEYRRSGTTVSCFFTCSCSGQYGPTDYMISRKAVIVPVGTEVTLDVSASVSYTAGGTPDVMVTATAQGTDMVFSAADLANVRVYRGTGGFHVNGTLAARDFWQPIGEIWTDPPHEVLTSLVTDRNLLPDLMIGIENVMADRFTALANTLVAVDIEADGPLAGSNAPVQLTSAVQDLTIAANVVQVQLGNAVGGQAVLPESQRGLGAIGRADCLDGRVTALDLSANTDVAAALPIDTLNAMLYAGWVGTALPIALGPSRISSVDVLPANTTLMGIDLWPMLPPVVTDCTADSSLEAQAGGVQVVLHLEALGEPVTATVTVDLVADVSFRPGERSILTLEPARIAFIRTDDTTPAGLVEAVEIMARRCVREVLLEERISSALDMIGPLTFSLLPLHPKGAELVNWSPFDALDGHLVRTGCADAGCTPGESSCSTAEEVIVCQQISNACTQLEVTQDCALTDWVCDDSVTPECVP